MSDDEPSARTRWLGVALILLALLALIWQAWRAGQADEAPPVVAAPVLQARPSLGEMLASVDSAKLGMQAASVAALTASGVPVAADEVELCGVGRVKANASGQPADMAAIRLAAQAARERLLPVLAASPDEAVRAAGLLLQGLSATGAGDAAVLPSAAASARDTLANLAVATRSPQVYAFAMRVCQGQRSEGMCQLLSAEQWVRLDPHNAMTWLHAATDAQARGDAAAVAEAMFHVSRASSTDLRSGALMVTVVAKLPADVPLLGRQALAEEMMAIDAGLQLPHLVASQYCSAADVRDANRQQTCAALADVLATKGRSLVDLGLSSAIGQRVGWPAERVEAARDERDALLQLAPKMLADTPARWSCASIDKTLRFVVDVGQQGELAAMRRTLKQSPDSVAVLARRYREAAIQRSADAASSPASAASQ